MTTRVESAEFVALTGCSLPDATITYLLTAADRAVDTELQVMGGPALPDDTLHDSAMLFAKALLADRNRFDGTFDVSTTEYSHKGSTDAIITSLKTEAREILRSEAMKYCLMFKKANAT
jgi:hypothetical protein